MEEEAVKERRRQELERERLAQRRKRRRLERKRQRLVRSKRLRTGVQPDVRRALEGELRAADIEGIQESEHESEDSEEEGAGARDRTAVNAGL